MLDFPDNPANGQTYTPPGGSSWLWDGVKWSGVSVAYLPLTGGTISGDLDVTGAFSVDGATTLNGITTLHAATGVTPATADNSTSLATTAYVKAQGYLLGNQYITLSGDVSGTGTTAIPSTVQRLQGRNVANTAPVDGQALVWSASSTQWQPGNVATSGGSAISIGDAPPASPTVGQQWFDSVGAQTYLWFNDGTSTQWVPLTSLPSVAGPQYGTGLYYDTATSPPTLSLSVPVAISSGGTAGTTAATALANLGGAPLASPVFTGDPRAPTPATADNDASIATTAFVKAQGYQTGNAMITLSGDVTGSGATTIATTTVQLQGRAVAATAPTTNQVLAWSGTQWMPATPAPGGVTNISAGTGITVSPSPITGTGSVALTVPVDETLGGTGLTSFAQGDMLYASAANTLTALPKDVNATQRVLTNGGASNNPAWAQVNAAQGISGTLTITNGGTGIAAPTQGDMLYYVAGVTYNRLLKDTNTTRYISNTGASNAPAWAQINLTNGVTGVLPVANGGTGSATGQTISLTGDVTGSGTTSIANTVVALQGRAVASTAPTTNQVLTWSGTQWAPAAGGGGGATISISDTAPASPSVGNMWFDSLGAQTYLWFNDGTSSQWVPLTSPPVVTGPQIGAGLTLNTATTPPTLSLSIPVAVSSGGTGQTSLTANNVLVGAGTSAVVASPNLTLDASNNVNVANSLGLVATLPTNPAASAGQIISGTSYGAVASQSNMLFGANIYRSAGFNINYLTGGTPAAFLQVDASPEFLFSTAAAGTAGAAVSPTIRMAIKQGVNIGGTTDPGAGYLTVSGSVAASSTPPADLSGGLVYAASGFVSTGGATIVQNAYWSSGGAWKLLNTSPANYIGMNGHTYFYSAPAGSVGAAPAWFQTALLTSNGVFRIISGMSAGNSAVTGNVGLYYYAGTGSTWAHAFAWGGDAFAGGGTNVGTINITSSSTQYNTTSDARLKKDLRDFDAGPMIDATEVYDFAWKETGERTYGVVAQEAIEVYPMAVHHEEARDWWGIDYSKYVPLLLQEMKALRARVAELEARQ